MKSLKSRRKLTLCAAIIASTLMLASPILPVHALSGIWLGVQTVAAWNYRFNNATQTYFKMRYFHDSTSSGIDSYRDLTEEGPVGTLATISQDVSTPGTYWIGRWVSEALPNSTLIPGGWWAFQLWTGTDGGTVSIKARVGKRDLLGGESLLCTSNESVVKTYQDDRIIRASFPETNFTKGERIVVEVGFEVYVGYAGSATFYYDTSTRNSRVATTEGSYKTIGHVGFAYISVKGTQVNGSVYFRGPWATPLDKHLNNFEGYYQMDWRDLAPWDESPPRKLSLVVKHEDVSKPARWVTKIYALNTNGTLSQTVWYQAVIPQEWINATQYMSVYVNGTKDPSSVTKMGVANWTLVKGYSWQFGYYLGVTYDLPASQWVNFTIVLDLDPGLTNPGWTPYSLMTSWTFYALDIANVTSVRDIPILPIGDTGDVLLNLDYTVGYPELPANYASLMIQHYKVTLPDPPYRLEDLIDEVDASDIHRGIKNSLVSKLNNAIKSLKRDRVDAAISQLNAFIDQVEALRGKKIPEVLADDWIGKATEIVDGLE